MEQNQQQELTWFQELKLNLKRRFMVPRYYKQECKVLKYQVKYAEYLARIAKAESDRAENIYKLASIKSMMDNAEKNSKKPQPTKKNAGK